MNGARSREHGAGFTLIEVIVVLAILGVTLGVTGMALASLRQPPEASRLGELRRARALAIRTGVPVQARADSSVLRAPLFLPDGSARGPGVDPLTGRPRAQ